MMQRRPDIQEGSARSVAMLRSLLMFFPMLVVFVFNQYVSFYIGSFILIIAYCVIGLLFEIDDAYPKPKLKISMPRNFRFYSLFFCIISVVSLGLSKHSIDWYKSLAIFSIFLYFYLFLKIYVFENKNEVGE